LEPDPVAFRRAGRHLPFVDLHQLPGRAGKKTEGLRPTFSINVVILPRQARDKHGENSTKRLVFLQVPLAGSKLWHRSSVMVHMNDLLTQPIAQVRKPALFEPFIYKSHLFTKTGSGQT